MGLYNKAVSVMVVALVIALTILGMKYYSRMATDTAARSALEKRLYECERMERDCSRSIVNQNAAIAAVKIDTVMMERRVKEVAVKYAATREAVTQSLEEGEGDYCGNQIDNIDDMLRVFSRR